MDDGDERVDDLGVELGAAVLQELCLRLRMRHRPHSFVRSYEALPSRERTHQARNLWRPHPLLGGTAIPNTRTRESQHTTPLSQHPSVSAINRKLTRNRAQGVEHLIAFRVVPLAGWPRDTPTAGGFLRDRSAS